jgi:ABC-2 type transport system ATP-binding protein
MQRQGIMNANREWVINTKALSKTYKNVQALKSLDLKVPRNSIFGFLGPNGAGKTTTIKLLLGLARPTAGSGMVFGKDILTNSVEVRRRIGYLAQNPSYYKHMTARQTLEFRARFFYSGPKDMIHDRVDETLELVGLTQKADRPIKGFSGGELQRLGIGQAQINYPELLILDEPAANLDPAGRRDVLEVMERLRKYTTIFYSTHILSDVQQVSDTVGILNHGELVAQASLDELLAGSEQSRYSVMLDGASIEIQQMVARQPWVSELNVSQKNGYFVWQVTVTDDEAARSELLRLTLSDGNTSVLEFGLMKYELEDVFLKITEGGQNVQR